MRSSWRRILFTCAVLALVAVPAFAQPQTNPGVNQIRLLDGDATTPSLAWIADTTLGLYRIGDDNMGVTIGGTLRWDWSTTRAATTLPIYFPDGSAAAPASVFTSDIDTGSWLSADGIYNISTAGVERFEIDATSIDITIPIYAADGSGTTPQYSFASDPDTGIRRMAANTLAFVVGGTERYVINSTGLQVDNGFGPIMVDEASSMTNPTLIPDKTELGTGLGGTANDLALVHVGVEIARITATAISLIDGTAAAPAYTFTSDVDTGWWSSAANVLNASTAGVERFELDATSLDITVPFATTGSYIAVGTTPATSGAFRLANAAEMYWRDAGDAVNLAVLALNSGDKIIIGSTASAQTGIDIRGGGDPITFDDEAQFLDGTAALPGLGFESDTDTGAWRSAANTYNLSTAGVERLELDATSLDITVPFVSSSVGPHAFGAATLDYVRNYFSGAFTSGGASTAAYGAQFDATITGASGDTTIIAGASFSNGLTTQGATETITTVAQVAIYEPGISVGSGDTVTNAVSLYIASVPTEGTNDYALWVDTGEVRIDGDIGDTTNRVTKLWTVDQDTTNAENVSSSRTFKHGITPYRDALSVVRGIDVATFIYNLDLDPSGRRKLGVIAESIHEPWALSADGLKVNSMALSALALRSIQQLEARIETLEAQR